MKKHELIPTFIFSQIFNVMLLFTKHIIYNIPPVGTITRILVPLRMRHVFYCLSNPWLFNKVWHLKRYSRKKWLNKWIPTAETCIIHTQEEAEQTKQSSKLWISEKATLLCPVYWPSWIAEFKKKNTVVKLSLQIMF